MATNTPNPNMASSRQEEGENMPTEVLARLAIGIAILEADGTVVSWDSQAEQLTGYSLQKVQDLDFVQLFTPAEVMQHVIHQAYHGISTLHQYVELKRSDNSHISVRVQCSPQFSNDQNGRRVVVAFRELAPIRARLGQHEPREMLGRLASSLAHELRNPLSTMFLHADLLEEESQRLAPDDRMLMTESLAEIKAELSRMDELVQDYLSFD